MLDISRRLPRLALLLAMACRSSEHGHEHGHDHGAGAAESDEPPALVITRWTARYELFVELPAPRPGQPVAYHAHVTALANFSPVTAGTFRVRYQSAQGVAVEHAQTGVKRPGIFAFEGLAPDAGEYALEMLYEHGGNVERFDGGRVVVAAPPVAPPDDAAGGAITFLKESQWKVPFATAWAEERPLANEMELPATVEPAASDQLTLSSPTDGRFFHNPELALAEGLHIRRGDEIGTVAPTVAGDDYGRVQFAVEEARVAREQARREIERIEPLVEQNIVPRRRLLELRNELETQTARWEAARRRQRQVASPGGQGGLTIRSTLAGSISRVLVSNGEPVEAGASLVRVSGTEHLWLRSRFIAKPASLLHRALPTGARLPSGEVIDLEGMGASFLSALPAIDPTSRIATWIVDVTPPASESSAPARDLRPGMNVVLSVRFGEPELLLAVPRSALVEINTRPYVFVQVDGEHFDKRPVSVGRADGAWLHIASGVKAGERVVTRGGYDIHLAALMGSVESHRH